jgi:CheY-like chemotaxis protein
MKNVDLLKSNGIDVEHGLELLGDMETYDEILDEFLNGYDERITSMKEYKDSNDMPNYAILVHSLKSDAKYLGLTSLAEISYQHEMDSKANNINAVYNNYDALMAEANRSISILKTYIGDISPVPTVVAPVATTTIKDKTILVVDDSDIIRTFIQKIFNDNYHVMMAHDGKEAIDIIGTSAYENIVGVLLDLNMPNIDGFEVLNYFKENNLFVKIPVSIITGDDSRDTIDRAFTYPITDVLQKPFNERDIKRIIDKMIAFSSLA